MISGVASGILIESVLMWATVNPFAWTSSWSVFMNSAPLRATMLFLFRTSLNGLSKFADVRPYTELIAILSACARSLAVDSSFRYGTSFPPNIFRTDA